MNVADPKPDTPVTFNGISQRFDQLPQEQQELVKRDVKKESIKHSDEVMNVADPKPDTPITINGISQRFDRLPQEQQDLIKRDIKAEVEVGDSIRETLTGNARSA